MSCSVHSIMEDMMSGCLITSDMDPGFLVHVVSFEFLLCKVTLRLISP